MEGPLKNRKLLLLVIVIGIALSSILATLLATNLSSRPKITNTEIRTRLLSTKNKTASMAGYEPGPSAVYSNVLYDFEVASTRSTTLPWAAEVPKDPNGNYSFTWRIRLAARAVFSVKRTAGAEGPYSIELIKRTGGAVYLKTDRMTLPSGEMVLEPDIYVLKATSTVPLDTFVVEFKTDPSAPPADPLEPPRLRAIHIKLNAIEKKDLDRLVTLALNSTDKDLIKMPRGRVKGIAYEEDSRLSVNTRIGLSGRTRVHMNGFPSIDVKVSGGKSLFGMTGFKLYRLESKNGLYNFTALSELADAGFFVPREELVSLYINNKRVGSYILMETNSPALFTNLKRTEGSILGVDSDKMFLNYPYDGELDLRYFYRLKGPHYEKKKAAFFLSADFVEKLDRDPTARYMAFASTYLSMHGLGVDDLRFYEDPATGLFHPIPRDMDPGPVLWKDSLRQYLAHLSWSANSPVYTIWPWKSLMSEDDRVLISETTSTTMFTDIHFALSSFIEDSKRLEAANRYLSYYSANTAVTKQLETRTRNALRAVYAQDPRHPLVIHQIRELTNSGYPFIGEQVGRHMMERGLTFSDGKQNWYWNIRTAKVLDHGLAPSLLAPLSYGLEGKAMTNAQYALAFELERRVFTLLKKAGVAEPRRTFKRMAPGANATGAISLTPGTRAPEPVHTGKGAELKVANVVTHLATLKTTGQKALVLFLVRNATEEARTFGMVMRGGIGRPLPPSLNTTFSLGEDTRTRAASIRHILSNHFLPGERMRLVAFEVSMSKRPSFYWLKLPAGSALLYSPIMYVPARSRPDPTTQATPAHTLPAGFIERADGVHVDAGARITLTGHVTIPTGKALYVHEGAVIEGAPQSSLKVTGDLYLLGTPERPVTFTSKTKKPWGGLYAAGRPGRKIRVTVKNASFDNYGTFPKTEIGNLYMNGGISFTHATVELDHVSIKDAKSEDAINLISSVALIKDTSITGAHSDSMDLDFSYAKIDGLTITGSNGDALDLSFSLVECTGSRFAGSKDKGLSVGEMSRVFVSDSVFSNNDMGIANKDQSFVNVKGSHFEGNRMAVAEFIKKPYFGRPVLIMENNTFKENKEKYGWLGINIY